MCGSEGSDTVSKLTAAEWNARYPVGQRVRVREVDGSMMCVTTGPAQHLDGHGPWVPTTLGYGPALAWVTPLVPRKAKAHGTEAMDAPCWAERAFAAAMQDVARLTAERDAAQEAFRRVEAERDALQAKQAVWVAEDAKRVPPTKPPFDRAAWLAQLKPGDRVHVYSSRWGPAGYDAVLSEWQPGVWRCTHETGEFVWVFRDSGTNGTPVTARIKPQPEGA